MSNSDSGSLLPKTKTRKSKESRSAGSVGGETKWVRTVKGGVTGGDVFT